MSKFLELIGCIMMFITALFFAIAGILFAIKVYIDWLSIIFPDKLTWYIVFVASLFILGLVLYLLGKIINSLKYKERKRSGRKHGLRTS